MKSINRFKLIPYDNGKSELMLDGSATGCVVDASSLKAQFYTDAGFLLITDYKDPWDSIGVATLISQSM